MTVSSIGLRVPDDLDREANPVYVESSYDEGGHPEMTHEVYGTTDEIGFIIGSSQEDVALVSWWRANTFEEAIKWITERTKA